MELHSCDSPEFQLLHVKKIIISSFLAMFSVGVSSAAPADDIVAAASKLGEAANYSWTRTETTKREPYPASSKVTEGVTEKGGFTVSKDFTRSVMAAETVRKGTLSVTLRPDGSWRSPEEMRARYGGGAGITVVGDGVKGTPVGGGSGRMASITIDVKDNGESHPRALTHAAEVIALLGETKGVAVVNDVFVGDLTDDAIARRLRVYGPDGQVVPVSQKSTGTAKFWVVNGGIAKYQIQIKGVFENGGAGLERTSTTEIKKVGATTVIVPDAAKSKLGI